MNGSSREALADVLDTCVTVPLSAARAQPSALEGASQRLLGEAEADPLTLMKIVHRG